MVEGYEFSMSRYDIMTCQAMVYKTPVTAFLKGYSPASFKCFWGDLQVSVHFGIRSKPVGVWFVAMFSQQQYHHQLLSIFFEFDENAYAFATAGLSSAPAHPHEDFRVKESQSFDRKSEMK